MDILSCITGMIYNFIFIVGQFIQKMKSRKNPLRLPRFFRLPFEWD